MRTALVTGASGGLGSAVARELSARGYRLILHYHRERARVEDVVRDCATETEIVQADLTNPGEVRELGRRATETERPLDALVQTAGFTREALLARTDEAVWDSLMEVNLSGPFRLLRACAASLSASHGHALFVLSHAGRHGRAGLAAYAAAKAGLEGLVIGASRELGGEGVKVNGVTPGFMLTPMGEGASHAARDRAIRENPLRVLADPADTALFIANLLEMPAVTGQVFPLEGRLA